MVDRKEQRTTPGGSPAGYLHVGASRIGLFCRAPECRHPAFRREGDQTSLPALLGAAADRDAHELAEHGLRYRPPAETRRRPWNNGLRGFATPKDPSR